MAIDQNDFINKIITFKDDESDYICIMNRKVITDKLLKYDFNTEYLAKLFLYKNADSFKHSKDYEKYIITANRFLNDAEVKILESVEEYLNK